MTAGIADLVRILQTPALGIVRSERNAIAFHLRIHHSVKIFPAQRTLDDRLSILSGLEYFLLWVWIVSPSRVMYRGMA